MECPELIPWSDIQKTGIRVIDADHHDLFDAVNELYSQIETGESAASDQVRATTDFLLRYVAEHFQREEDLMAKYGYPKLEAHKRLHQSFVKTVYAMRRIEIDAPHLIDSRRLVSYLGVWLQEHIAHADQQYIPYLTGNFDGEDLERGHAVSSADGKPLSQEDGDPGDADALVSITVSVPQRFAGAVRKLEFDLNHGPDFSPEVQALIDPLNRMSLEEAKILAKHVLREDCSPGDRP